MSDSVLGASNSVILDIFSKMEIMKAYVDGASATEPVTYEMARSASNEVQRLFRQVEKTDYKTEMVDLYIGILERVDRKNQGAGWQTGE